MTAVRREALTLNKEDNTNLVSVASTEVSPYDASYPIMLLSNSLKSRLIQADTAVKAIYRAVAKEAPVLAQAEQALKKGYRYVVDATESTLEAIDSGKIRLTTEKSG